MLGRSSVDNPGWEGRSGHLMVNYVGSDLGFYLGVPLVVDDFLGVVLLVLSWNLLYLQLCFIWSLFYVFPVDESICRTYSDASRCSFPAQF